MMQTKKELLDTDTSSSENSSRKSALTNETTCSTSMTDEMSCKRQLLSEVQLHCKRHKDNTEVNFREKPSTAFEEISQVSGIEENPSMHICEKLLCDVIDVTNNTFKHLSQTEKSEIMVLNANSHASQMIPPKNQPFIREVIHLSKSILYPETSSYSSNRDKPLGCKTIFVSGLPQKITENIIKEIFRKCGSLAAVRMSEKDFCYISFYEELSVESAMFFSGYRLKIDNKNEAPYTGILHVDYAEADFVENSWNCPQTESYSIMSTFSDTHCSEFETGALVEKLQSENTFHEALCKLTEWLKLKKGSKKNNINLFSLMQNIYFHVLYLVEKKERFEQDVTKLKSDLVEYIKQTCKLLVDIENTFKSSQEQKNWAFFTNSQKKFIKLWEKHCKEWKNQFIEELASFERQENLLEEKIELNIENDFHIEDSDGQNQGLNGDDYYFGSVTPVPLHHTDHAASIICDKLNNKETFLQAANILMMWLEKEECTNNNAASFFTMIQCIHNHVTQLHSDKNKCEEKLEVAKETLIRHFKEVICCLTKIQKIYTAVSLNPCSNNFTYEERTSIELWKKYAEELKSDIKKKVNELKAKIKVDKDKKNVEFFKELKDKIHALQKVNSNLQYHCNKVQNNITTMQSNHKKDFEHLDGQLADIQKAIRNSQNAIFKLKEKCFINEIQVKELRKIIHENDIENELIMDNNNDVQLEPIADSPHIIQENEARIIGLVSAFLHFHPGASIDTICTYLHGIDSTLNCGIVENIMHRFPTLYREDISGIGATMKRKWYFKGFQT